MARKKEAEAEKLEVQPLRVGERLRFCPGCGYRDGFHVALERGGGPASTNVQLKLICPSCHSVYDVGLGAFLK